MIEVNVTIDFGEPETDLYGRWAHLKLNGLTIFSDLVYDTDSNGNRSEEQAATNLLNLFRHRLGQLLGEE